MSFLRSGLSAGLFLLVAAASLDASAQSSSLTAAAVSAVRADVRARATATDSLLEFRTRRIGAGRVDIDAGVLRAEYRIQERLTRRNTPTETAAEYLRSRAAAYGLASDLSDLRVEFVRQSGNATHVVFQQTLAGVPVLRRQIKVNLDRNGLPAMVVSAYAPHLRDGSGFNPDPSVPAARALQTALEALTVSARSTDPELFVLAEKRPRLVWRVIAWPETGGEWEILVDAHTAAVVSLHDQAIRDRFGTGEESEANGIAVGMDPASTDAVALVDGSGLVFDPDPLTRAGMEYGGGLVDGDDSDTPELNAQRVEVVLREISQGTDGLYRLRGPFVEIVGSGVGQTYQPPALTDPNGFRFTRSDPRFEAVMAYYHIDDSQRYVDALAAGIPPSQVVAVNPRGTPQDNSEYYPFQHAISFGTGGIDDAEDASVIRHEYAHAILNNTAPGLLGTTEGQQFHEGWADYWAASYQRHLVESGAVPPADWTHIFSWDGNPPSSGWCGRYLNHPGHYPDQMFVAAPSGCGEYPQRYQAGLLWATTLMEIYDDLGREVTDRLNLASHAYLNSPVTMADAAEALIQADVDLYGGVHTGTLVSRLGARGFVDVSAHGPVLAHERLRNTESLGGTAPIEVRATGSTAPVDSVIVYYGTTPIPLERLVLEPVGDGLYRGDLPLPSTPDTLRYYIEAVDALQRRTFLPGGGAADAFIVVVGPDATAPVIVHTPILSSSLAAWPAVVTATVNDDIGVDTVYVGYSAFDSLGNQTANGAFGLVDTLGVYMAPFPIDIDLLGPGSQVEYRIYARDASTHRNLGQLPADSYFRFRVVIEGVLRAYDFESPDPGIVATGAWALGEPDFGVRVAHSGDSLWATNPTGTYPASPQLSTLELPRLNLLALESAYLVFWHWYDFEHNGQAVPDSSREVPLWDGGNVKVSVDDGRTWSVAIPEGGYPGVVEFGLQNPLEGEPAFGGFSYGWRRVVVPLPTESNVQIRFDFGTDLSNQDISVAYAGWYIDDVIVTTEVDEDVDPPQAMATLPDETLRAPGQPLPRVAVTAFDDTGVGLVDVRYEFYPAQGAAFEGRFRLTMADTSLHYFEGAFPITRDFSSGDRLDFRIRVRDFAGNEVDLPDRSQPPFRILYRHLDRIRVLSGARGSGHWVADTEAQHWHVETGPHHQRSGLVLDRVDLPGNAESVTLELRHDYRFENGAGGNVKVSADGGDTWAVVSPRSGYSGRLDVAPPHPMAGQQVFTGGGEGGTTSRFDLTPYAGQQVQVRVDLGLVRPLRSAEWWRISDAAILFATQDPEFDVPRTLALHPNFPDPFSETTTISYTLPERVHVTLEVYDLLGRRLVLLEDRERVAGTYTSTFDASGLAAGMYLLRLRAGSTQRVERLVVAR